MAGDRPNALSSSRLTSAPSFRAAFVASAPVSSDALTASRAALVRSASLMMPAPLLKSAAHEPAPRNELHGRPPRTARIELVLADGLGDRARYAAARDGRGPIPVVVVRDGQRWRRLDARRDLLLAERRELDALDPRRRRVEPAVAGLLLVADRRGGDVDERSSVVARGSAVGAAQLATAASIQTRPKPTLTLMLLHEQMRGQRAVT
jgi:hypothetical protein